MTPYEFYVRLGRLGLTQREFARLAGLRRISAVDNEVKGAVRSVLRKLRPL